MTAVWIGLLLGAVFATSVASRFAVTSALRVSEQLNVSPALVGLTVMAIGTDLPEIANSIVSSASGHGDVNVGDSMGSALTQVTLTLGLLCFAGGTITTNRNFVLAVGTATVFAVAVVRMLANDRDLSRSDGLVLVALWLAGTALLGHGELKPREMLDGAGTGLARDVISALGWLGLVGLLAVMVVELFLLIAESLGIPEFVGSFLALSLGTSLPELFVDWTAIRRGASSMAVGDIFGSSFVDATLSIGIGPALFATAISAEARAGTVVVAVGILVTTLLVTRARRYDWRLALPLFAVYLVAQVWIAGFGVS